MAVKKAKKVTGKKGQKPDASPDADILLTEGENLAPVPLNDRNPLQIYLQDVGKVPLLSPEEEKSLALQVYNQKDKEALKKLVQSNLRFVVKIAFEYSRYGAKILDLIQEGNMGLLRAVQEFNPYKEVRLTTYAVFWIRSYIQDFLLRNWSLVRVGTTAAQKKLFYRLKKEQERLEREGIEITPKAIAMTLGVPEEDVKTMQLRLSGKDLSLSTPTTPGEDAPQENFLSKVPDSEPLALHQLESSEQSILFKKALEEFKQKLDEREQNIFANRLLSENPRTLVDIGEEYGITRERARQLEERILNKLREFLSAHYPDISLN